MEKHSEIYLKSMLESWPSDYGQSKFESGLQHLLYYFLFSLRKKGEKWKKNEVLNIKYKN